VLNAQRTAGGQPNRSAQPGIGHIRIGRLRVTDIAAVFEAIEEQNETIRAARDSGDPGCGPPSRTVRSSADALSLEESRFPEPGSICFDHAQ
jgi:hypothetical protein